MEKEKENAIKKMIQDNIKSLVKVYQEAYSRACYRPHEAGNNAVFYAFSNLVSSKLREGLSMHECVLFNQEIKQMAIKAVNEVL